MALHRDIFWVGRQWAVTGYGIQAVDQKNRGQFDIEAGRLWEDGLAESLHADGWLNREDFGKALAAARERFPEPPRKTPPPEPARDIVDLKAGAPVAPLRERPKPPALPVEPPTELLRELARSVERPAPPVMSPPKTPAPEPPREIAEVKAVPPVAPLVERPKPVELPVDLLRELARELTKPVEPPAPRVEPPLRKIAEVKADAPIVPSKVVELPVEAPAELAAPVELPASPVEAPSPAPQTFELRILGWPAKFLKPWRARVLR